MYKRKFVSEMVMKDLSAIVVNICCPAMILASVFQDMSDISRKNVGIVTGIGIVYYVLLIVFGYAFVKIFRVQTKEKEAYVLMSTFGNVGFIGFPVSLAILGHKSILYVVIFNFLYNIFIFTFGIALVRKGTEGDKKQSWTDIFTPGFVCQRAGQPAQDPQRGGLLPVFLRDIGERVFHCVAADIQNHVTADLVSAAENRQGQDIAPAR